MNKGYKCKIRFSNAFRHNYTGSKLYEELIVGFWFLVRESETIIVTANEPVFFEATTKTCNIDYIYLPLKFPKPSLKKTLKCDVDNIMLLKIYCWKTSLHTAWMSENVSFWNITVPDVKDSRERNKFHSPPKYTMLTSPVPLKIKNITQIVLYMCGLLKGIQEIYTKWSHRRGIVRGVEPIRLRGWW